MHTECDRIAKHYAFTSWFDRPDTFLPLASRDLGSDDLGLSPE